MATETETQEKKLKSLQEDYRSTFSSETGKKVLDDLRHRCFCNDTTFADNPYVTAFNEGSRAVVLHIEQVLTSPAREGISREGITGGNE